MLWCTIFVCLLVAGYYLVQEYGHKTYSQKSQNYWVVGKFLSGSTPQKQKINVVKKHKKNGAPYFLIC